MKQTYLALFLLLTLSIASCRKSGNDIDIKTYDNNQIRDYIAANALNGMKRDTVGGDTSGIYYQIMRQGKGAAIKYETRIYYSFTLRSLDGRYSATDTITSRSTNLAGLLSPKGLMMVIHNVISNKGTSARFLIPSRLAYGLSGISLISGRIPGNGSLDFTINILSDDNAAAMAAYDDLTIRNYCTANNININSYTKTASGLYVKINQSGTGTTAITATSTANLQYSGFLLNGTSFGGDDSATGAAFDMQSVVAGFQEGLIGTSAGAKVDLLIPSRLAYGLQNRTTPNAAGQIIDVIPYFSCLRYGINVMSVTN